MNLLYRVTLLSEERIELEALVSGGKRSVRRIKRAQILLAAAYGVSDDDIATTAAVGTSTVYRTKKRFVEEGLEAALSEDKRPGVERKLSAADEALLVATACSKAPEGRPRWTLELLAGVIIQLTEHRSLSAETSVVDWGKISLNHGKRRCGAFPRWMPNLWLAWRTSWSCMLRCLTANAQW